MMEPYPTPETITDWDDASLLATTGCASVIRYHEHGFASLNPTERLHCCFNLLESCINNGGVGHWVESLCPLSAPGTVSALCDIDADEMAKFVTNALLPMGDINLIRSKDAWAEHYLAIADTVHEQWETQTAAYLDLEPKFLTLAYAYVRRTWHHVRAA